MRTIAVFLLLLVVPISISGCGHSRIKPQTSPEERVTQNGPPEQRTTDPKPAPDDPVPATQNSEHSSYEEKAMQNDPPQEVPAEPKPGPNPSPATNQNTTTASKKTGEREPAAESGLDSVRVGKKAIQRGSAFLICRDGDKVSYKFVGKEFPPTARLMIFCFGEATQEENLLIRWQREEFVKHIGVKIKNEGTVNFPWPPTHDRPDVGSF